MVVTLLALIAAGLVVLIVILTFLSRRNSGIHKKDDDQGAAHNQPVRRAAGARNARRRLRGNAAAQPDRVDNVARDEGNEEQEDKSGVPDGKMGTKKRAKLEAKAEKKALREIAERERGERKKRDQLLLKEREKLSEEEKAEEQRQEEAERKAREEQERREYEEYLKMKEAFSVEEEGFDEDDEDEQRNLLQEFLDYIKQTKVVLLEDIALHFKMKTPKVIKRIQDLQADGILTGVIDDRGKFIYISQEELEAVAKFVRQRGRVSISELAENSSRLINLNPDNIIEAR
ncbi:DDRGK domain-containing protein 1 [Orussus abietinus]|uniref:DDRGK domain-containing protein 1 n=1 Tax=Orussus abietinus TaxID=222816 RepID=UPI00062630B1|nr:DDRGK domain-containing protein 1 [Orussus abietinus]